MGSFIAMRMNNTDESHKQVEIKLDFFIWNIKEYIMYNSCKSSSQTGKIYVIRSKINGTLEGGEGSDWKRGFWEAGNAGYWLQSCSLVKTPKSCALKTCAFFCVLYFNKKLNFGKQ